MIIWVFRKSPWNSPVIDAIPGRVRLKLAVVEAPTNVCFVQNWLIEGFGR